MKGIPAYIQTREDLQNLFALAQQGEIDKEALTEKINGLLSLQYRHTPILTISGNTVTTRYLYEVAVGDTTIEGLNVTAVQHIEQQEEDGADSSVVSYSETQITLSEALEPGAAVLSLYAPANFLTENSFDIAEIKYILGVLAQ